MNNTNNNYCVILAGGKGRRLWPCSRESKPKQFIDFFGSGRTQLQQTYDRFKEIVPVENIYVNTNDAYIDLVLEQLPDLAPDHLLAEPIHRGTAPSVAWCAHRIIAHNPDANIVIAPSDQTIIGEEAFAECISRGFDFVANNRFMLTLGLKPTRPEPGYGYIQMGDKVEDGVYKVQSFTEKPERDFAKIFVDSGEFYWNTGIFLSNISYLRECLKQIFPVVLRKIDTEREVSLQEELDFVKENFPSYPNLSIDYGILDKNDNVYVMRCGFGWADLGQWHSIYEGMSKGTGDNVVIGSKVIAEDSRNNIIKLPDDHLGIINGLDGYIVAEKGNVLLICKKEDSSALIRKYINEVQVKFGEEYI